MTIKSFYTLLLSATTLILASCSTEVTDEQSAVAGSATRSFVVREVQSPMTRTNVSLTKGFTWNKGDRLFAYNITSPRKDYDYLSTESDGYFSKFIGDVHWKDGDDLALFYPFRYEQKDSHMGVLSLGLEENKVYDKGNVVKGHQNGTVENFRFFDYSWSKVKNISSEGVNTLADVSFDRQYSVLGVTIQYKGQPLKKIKSLTLQNVYTKAEFDLATGKLKYEPKGEMTINAEVPLDTFYVLLFPDTHFSPKFIVETVDGEKYTSGDRTTYDLQRARYYFENVLVSCNPCIDIDGTKWGRYNLQYEPCTNLEGWVPGYRLAKQAWDYFYTNSDPFNLYPDFLPRAFNTSAFDHFRWGNIAGANNYSYSYSRYYSYHMGNLQAVIQNRCYGDLAYYASNGKFMMPTKADFDNLMAKTGEYVGYYQDGCNIIVGVLFDPTVPACKKGKVLDKNGHIIGNTNRPNGIYVGKYYERNTHMKKFSKEDIDKGVFFPFAGAYTEYNDGAPRLQRPGGQAYYWTSDANRCNYAQATAFSAYYMNNGWLYPGTVNGSGSGNNPKYNMYNIRPLCVSSDSKTKQNNQTKQSYQTKKGW